MHTLRLLKWLSKQEKVNNAIEYMLLNREVMKFYVKDDNGDTLIFPNQSISYRNVQEFVLKNPNCCTLNHPEKPYPDHWSRILGTFNYSVQINFTGEAEKQLNAGSSISEEVIFVEAFLMCGSYGQCRIFND